MNRLDRLFGIMDEYEADAVIISGENNVRYFSGYTGEEAQLLAIPGKAWFFTDGRYAEQAEEEVQGFEIDISVPVNRRKAMSDIVRGAGAQVIGFDFAGMSAAEYALFGDVMPEGVEFADVTPIIEEMREVKDFDELARMAAAAAITKKAYAHILKFIKPGVTGLDIKAELTMHAIKSGSALSFEPIIVSGPRGSLPHGKASDAPVKPGEFITIDMGHVYDGYCSDFTRTFALGEPDGKMRRAYDVVLEAYRAGIAAAREGVACSEVDKAARDVIEASEFAGRFVHGLGHGVGRDIHESPYLNARTDMPLKEGMIVTIEPGVYLENEFGVRTEDMFMIKNDGCELFEVASTDLFII